MNIVVKKENLARITEVIDTIQKKTSVREISAYTIFRAIDVIEKKIGIAKNSMTGIVADVDIHADKMPNAYGYTPYSTQFTIKKTRNGWNLIEISRKPLHQSQNYTYILTLTDEAKNAIIQNMEHFD